MPDNVNNNSWVVNFPNSIVWAFNPNYIEITAPSEDEHPYVTVTIGNNPPIKAVLYNGHAKVYVSRLLQICFGNPKVQRVKNINVQVWTSGLSSDTPAEEPTSDGGVIVHFNDEYAVELLNANYTVVWGGINLGERAYNYGVYAYEEGRGWLTSHVQMFENFPFTLELLMANATKLLRRTDRTAYEQLSVQQGNGLVTVTKEQILAGLSSHLGRTVVYRQELGNINEGGTFDTTFDYTFHTPADTTVITHVHLRQELEGYYLRWISHFGFMQYYLFDKGDHETHTERTATIPEEVHMDGMYFGGSARGVSVKSTRNLKMCAMNLNQDTLAYVQDIVASPFVDLYIGLDKQGNEIWQPVRVADDSFTVKTLHNYLCDFEINVELPDNVTQTL